MKITENTTVSVGILIAVAGSIVWMTTVWSQGLENARTIVEIKEQKSKEAEVLREILQRVTRIEERQAHGK